VLQIVGRRGEDDVVLAAAAAFESLLPWQSGYDRVGTSAVVGVGSGQ
jgi:Asp-tRNA(Asn)/Glu-tRNA(Gln) amidotransferase A subunit family amidase